MKFYKTEKKPFRSTLFVFLVTLFLFSGMGISARSAGDIYQVKDNYRIKRTSDGTVSLYSKETDSKEDVYVFTDFNADVLLMVYRRIDMNSIIKNMSKKYTMSKKEARRSVKMTLNELEYWDLIVRK